MALPVRQDLKDYLRIETNDEDDRLDTLLFQAENVVETFLGRPMIAIAQSWVDETEGTRWASALLFPIVPMDSSEAVVVKDADGLTVPSTDYRVDRRTGMLRAEPGVAFCNGPYTITAKAGLSAASDYATRIEPVLCRAILAYASHAYHRTNPSAVSESAGGGAGTGYADALLPSDVRALIEPFRLERVA